MSKPRAKRGNGECTVRRRTDGRWEGRYRDALTGKLKSVYRKTQKEVLKLLEEKTKEYNIGEISSNQQLTVGQWVPIWLERYNGNIKPLTLASYRRILKNHILPEFQDKKLIELKTGDLQDFYSNLSEFKHLSPKTVKNIHGVLHKLLNRARVVGYIKTNIADDAVLPRVEKPSISYLEDDLIAEFVAEAKKDKFSSVFLITLFTGMRQSEVLGLTWDRIDFKRGVILISKQLLKIDDGNGTYYCLAPTKSDKERMIAPAQFVFQILQDVFQKQLQAKKNKGNEWQATGEFRNLVFTNDDGRHLSHCTVYKHCKSVLSRIGMPQSRFHDLRHSYAVLSLQNGDDIKTVQENLGHYSSAFTLDTYTHMTKRMQYESANRMDNFISKNIV